MRSTLRRLLLLVVLMSLLGLVPVGANAQTKDVAILVVDNVGWTDWLAYSGPEAKKLFSQSAIALSNNRTEYDFDPASTFLTIGAGTRAGVSGLTRDRAGTAFDDTESIDSIRAIDLFERYTGIRPLSGQGFHLAMPAIIEQSLESDYGATPGLLGQTLKEHGKIVAVLGNADTDKPDHREAFMIGMDENGIVPIVRLDNGLTKADNLSPYNKTTDIRELNAAIVETLEKADLTIIDYGDTARAERMRAFVTETRLEDYRREALGRLDSVIGSLMEAGRQKQIMIIIVAATANERDRELGKKLTPIAIHWPEGGKTTLLGSDSTRREGLVLATDLAPTVLEWLDVPVPAEMSGKSLRPGSIEGSIDAIVRDEDKIAMTSLARPLVLRLYITALIIFLIASLLIIGLNQTMTARGVRRARFLIRWLMAIPVVLLLLGLLPRPTALNILLLGLPLSLLAAWLTGRGEGRHNTMIATIMGLTSAIVVIDLFTGQSLMKSSVLGYDPIIGARFYGVGNEVMGLTIGSAVIGTAIILESGYKKIRYLFLLTIITFLLVTGAIGLPPYGANVGGLITALVTFLIALFKFKGYKVTWQRATIIAAALTGVLLLVLAWDMVFASRSSHFGQAIDLLKSGGFEQIWLIAKRKLEINYKLLQWTIWSRVFLLSLLVYGFLFMRPIGLMKGFIAENQKLAAGIVSVVIGSIVAMTVNDSGVVAGATTIIFAVLIQLYVIIDTYQGETKAIR